MTEDVRFTLSADNTRANAALAQTEARIRGVGNATQFTRAQMQQLNFQITDIVPGLATGQSPFTVLQQQGGQLRDTFGGIGGAARALAAGVGAMVNLFTLAIGATAGLGAAFVAADRDATNFAKAFALTGNAAGFTAARYEATAQRIADATRSTVGDTKDLVQGLIQNGAFGPEAVQSMALAAARIQSLTGKTSDEVIASFSGMSRSVADWAQQANRSYHRR
jgi:phage-related minor tail protein